MEACVVVGVPDDESGSVACAVVARKFGTNTNAGDIKKFVDGNNHQMLMADNNLKRLGRK